MSVTQKPLPGADSQHFLAISYPLDWEKTLFFYQAAEKLFVQANA